MLSVEIPESPTFPEVVKNARILVVEDEAIIRSMIVLALENEGYEVNTVQDGNAAMAMLQLNGQSELDPSFDLVILDLMLPEVNGLDICRLLRYNSNFVPVMITSAKVTETDRVLGLEVGADDYLTKPFSTRELVARCRALLRRQMFQSFSQTTIHRYKDIALFPKERLVFLRGKEVNLSPKEFRVLELFLASPRRVWSREQLIEQIWGVDFLGDTKTVDVHIRWLREKLEMDPSQPEYLITVRGFGYRLN
jgi:two-component system phosphate regulon response regulator PhoB